MCRIRLLVASLLLLVDPGLPGNVLVVLPTPVYSHIGPFVPVMEELAKRGHDITFISPLKHDSLPKGVTHVNVETNMSMLGATLEKAGFNGQGLDYKALGILSLTHIMCQTLLPPVLKALPPPSSKFDLIIAEIFFGQEVLAVLGHIYNAPVVAKHPGPLTPFVAHILGNPNIDSYTPNVRLKFSEDMSFLERTANLVISKLEVAYYFLFTLPRLEKVVEEFFPQEHNLPPLIDMLRNVSLLMTETHFAVNYQRPLHRNIIEIGGMGVTVLPPIPEDLEKMLNESESGVIYFSLGSHYYDPNKEETIAGLMDTFSKLKQKVFFKWANTSIPGVPDNVVVRSWFPQNSILSHKNVVLYICHGGLNSIYEAVYYGIPVVGTPIFVDQPHNINILKHFGLAEYVDFESIGDRVTLLNAIKKVLSNPSYRENAKKRSRMLRDRPLPILEEVAYWLEYVMKHGGDALRPASTRLPAYILMQLDVLLFFTAITLFIVLIPVFIVRKCRQRNIKIKHKKKVQ